jgi:thiosulfate dehydrogenase
MGKLLIGLILGILLIPACFYLYLRSGRAPVATSAAPMPLERFLVHTAMHATIESQEPKNEPSAPNDAALISGAQIYHQNCAVCHGLPNESPTLISKGMYPQPPQFFWPRPKRIDDPAGEIYWKVKNGIRLTGMPGFHATFSEEQLWQVSEMVADAANLPPAAVAALEPAPPSISQPKPAPALHTRSKRKVALHM